jgi:FAD/FMN-containing dehydrogenase
VKSGEQPNIALILSRSKASGLRRVGLRHFGHGLVHCRLPFEFGTQSGREKFRVFVNDAADLVVSYGGSISGEHGNGQARAVLLPKMF